MFPALGSLCCLVCIHPRVCLTGHMGGRHFCCIMQSVMISYKHQCQERLYQRQAREGSTDIIFWIRACNNWKEVLAESFLGPCVARDDAQAKPLPKHAKLPLCILFSFVLCRLLKGMIWHSASKSWRLQLLCVLGCTQEPKSYSWSKHPSLLAILLT